MNTILNNTILNTRNYKHSTLLNKHNTEKQTILDNIIRQRQQNIKICKQKHNIKQKSNTEKKTQY